MKAKKDLTSREKHGRYDLITPYGLRRLALRYHMGTEKYGERNWEKGVSRSDCMDSILRHATQYQMGDREEDHIAAIAWWSFAIMHFEDTGYYDESKKMKGICGLDWKDTDIGYASPGTVVEYEK